MECPDKNYDFIIKRNSTHPSLRLKVFECDKSPIDLSKYEITASMWSNGRLKNDISVSSTQILLIDNVGFNEVSVGDIILLKNSNNHELVYVNSIDENKLNITRGYFDTDSFDWKKGSKLKIIKFMNSSATYDLVREDVLKLNGEIESNILVESYLVYNWFLDDTRVPGNFYLEFKIIEKNSSDEIIYSRKYPEEKEGIHIQILDNNLETY